MPRKVPNMKAKENVQEGGNDGNNRLGKVLHRRKEGHGKKFRWCGKREGRGLIVI
jgi:hypothetical protein